MAGERGKGGGGLERWGYVHSSFGKVVCLANDVDS